MPILKALLGFLWTLSKCQSRHGPLDLILFTTLANRCPPCSPSYLYYLYFFPVPHTVSRYHHPSVSVLQDTLPAICLHRGLLNTLAPLAIYSAYLRLKGDNAILFLSFMLPSSISSASRKALDLTPPRRAEGGWVSQRWEPRSTRRGAEAGGGGWR